MPEWSFHEKTQKSPGVPVPDLSVRQKNTSSGPCRKREPGQPVPAVHDSGKKHCRAQVHDQYLCPAAPRVSAPDWQACTVRHDEEVHEGEGRKRAEQDDEPGYDRVKEGAVVWHEWVLAMVGDMDCGRISWLSIVSWKILSLGFGILRRVS